MHKRYQIFVSSTYLDLKKERKVVIDTILGLGQIPVGMELFEASDKEQWDIITETIDSSDYYVLIIRWKYGTIIKDGDKKGISYTEKEFDYAVSKGIPVLAFIIADEVKHTKNKTETDPDKAAGLLRFIEKVKTGRTVKSWHTANELGNLLAQSLAKRMSRGGRPGWVRTTEFDIEKSHAEIIRLTERVHMLEALNADLRFENNRKPNLRVEVCPGVDIDGNRHLENIEFADGSIFMHILPVDMQDAANGIYYKDESGRDRHAGRDEVRAFRYVCKNAFLLQFRVHNDGDIRATGVRIRIRFPEYLLTISERELMEYISPDTIGFWENAFENWDLRFFSPSVLDDSEKSGNSKEELLKASDEDKFISMEELMNVGDVSNLLDPADYDNGVAIFPGDINITRQEILHKLYDTINGVYVLPTAAGEFELECSIICNEYPDVITQKISVIVD